MDGMDVLEQGLVRRIGNRETTTIWNSYWLPTNSLRVPVPSNLPDKPHLVSDLIDHTAAAWDQFKLLRFFTPAGREVVANIPICTSRQEDFWAWHYDKKGMFTVRSAYRMLISKRTSNVEGRSDRRAEEMEWLSLW